MAGLNVSNIVDRAIVIIPIEAAAACNAMAASIDHDAGGGSTFGAILLSQNGSPPATHTACNAAIGAATRSALPELAEGVPGARVFFSSDGWGWAAALAAAALAEVQGAEQ